MWTNPDFVPAVEDDGGVVSQPHAVLHQFESWRGCQFLVLAFEILGGKFFSLSKCGVDFAQTFEDSVDVLVLLGRSVVIEQFLDFALRVADYCYVMEKGHIVSEGNTSALSQDIIREHLSV